MERIESDTVRDRFEQVGREARVSEIAAGVALAAAIGFVLLFVQEPMVHDALHNFRHAAGITCH